MKANSLSKNTWHSLITYHQIKYMGKNIDNTAVGIYKVFGSQTIYHAAFIFSQVENNLLNLGGLDIITRIPANIKKFEF